MRTRPFSWLFAATVTASVAFASCSSSMHGTAGSPSSAGAPAAGSSTTTNANTSTAGSSGSTPSAAGMTGGAVAMQAGAGSNAAGASGRAATAGSGGAGSAAPMNVAGAPMTVAGASGAAGSGGAGAGAFALTSPDFKDGDHFAAKFTCASATPMQPRAGNAPNPELDWSGAPSGSMSFAITFIDTTLGDTSPLGQHWAIWNIPASVMKFPQGTMMLTGNLAMAKQSGPFFPPCAQSLMNGMDDQYEFAIYALGTATLNVQGMSVANALTALKSAQVLGKATLRGHAGKNGM